MTKARTLAPNLVLPDYYARIWFIFFTLMLLLFTRIVLPLEIVGGPEEDYLVQTRSTGGLGNFYKLCYAFTLLVMVAHIPSIAVRLFAQPVLLFFLAYVTLSVPFANPASESFPKAVEYGFASLLGIYLAQRLSYQRYTELLVMVFGAVIIISLFYVLLLPHGTITDPNGITSMRGGFQNKNSLGLYAAPAALLFSLRAFDLSGRAAFRNWLITLLSIWFVLDSGAGSSQIALLFSVLLVAVVWLLKRSPIKGLLAITIGLIAFFIMLAGVIWFYDDVLALFGTDRSWTGRLTTFGIVFEVIGGNLFFGTHGTNVAIEFIQGVERGNAHSGHLNILLFYGLIGGVLFFSLLLQMLYAALAMIKSSVLSLWPFAFLLFVTVSNITEASTEGVVYWTMLVAHLVGAKTWKIAQSTPHE